jgi:MarR family transcriptional regulator, organic hydroperoxide resistance regulator
VGCVVGDWASDWTSDRFQVAFWTTKRAMAEAADAAYRRHGVRSGQQFILMALWDEDGLTPGELAQRLGLATPTITKATHRMEAAGLLVRRPHPRDRRLVRIHLTDRGMALRKDLDAEMHALSERALAGFTDAERARFVEYLERLYRSLRKRSD